MHGFECCSMQYITCTSNLLTEQREVMHDTCRICLQYIMMEEVACGLLDLKRQTSGNSGSYRSFFQTYDNSSGNSF